MGFPVRTKGTGNTEHMFSGWGLVGTGNREQGNKSVERSKKNFCSVSRKKFVWGGGILKGTGNREQETCRVPQVFPEYVPEPLRENPSLEKSCDFSGEIFRERNYCPRTAFSGKKFARF